MKQKKIADLKECPKCRASWVRKDPVTEYSRLIGVEVRGGYDGVSYWQCPDCRTMWDRWTGIEVGKSIPGFQEGTGDGTNDNQN